MLGVRSFVAILSILATGAYGAETTMTKDAATLAPDNPFARASQLPFQLPPFDRIADAHIGAALEAGMSQQRREIDAIASDPSPATFENTIAALECSGE